MTREQSTRTSTRSVFIIVLTLCLAVGLAFTPGAVAQTDSPTDDDPSPVPAAYYGSVTVVGDADVDGLEVTAEVAGTEYGPITTDGSEYGGPTGADEKLVVDPEEVPDDAQVTFFVEGNNIERTEVTQTNPRPILWEEGAEQQVDLTVVLDDQDLPNLATTVTADDEQQLEDGLQGEVLVENLGETSTGDQTTVTIEAEGTPRDSDKPVQYSVNKTVGELASGENQTIDISTELTDWAQQNEVVDGVTVTAEADPDDEIQESTRSTNVDQTSIDVTYLELKAEASTPDSVVEGQNITLRSFITNDGTAEVDTRDVNVTIENGDTQSYEFSIDNLASGDQITDRTKKSFDTNDEYTMTVEIDEDGNDIFTDNYTATSTFTVEPYNLTLRDAEDMRVSDELRVGSTAVSTFFYETNASEPINATIDLPAEIETSDNETKTIDSSVGNNTVSWPLNATETTAGEVEINVTVEDTLDVDESDNVTVNTSVPRVTDRIRNTSSVILGAGETNGTTQLAVSNSETFEQNVTLTFEGGAEGRTLSGLEYLVRYPYGCVEQTTSSFLGALNTKQYYEDRKNYEIDDDQYDDINVTIEDGVAKLADGGSRAQLDDGGWNAWGRQGADSKTFYTSYALFGTTSVAEDPDYNVEDYGSGDIDFTKAVEAIQSNQKNSGAFEAESYYFRDRASMTGFTMVALNQTVQSGEAPSSEVASIQADAAEYLVDNQENSGAWTTDPTYWDDTTEESATSTGLALWGLQAALDNDQIDWNSVETNETEVENTIQNGHEWLIKNQEMDNAEFQGSWSSYQDSTWWNRQGDTSEEAAFATYGLDATNETVGDLEVEVDGTNRTTQHAIDNSTQFLTSVYEDSGSWGYTRATAFSIGALTEVTGEFASEVTVELTWGSGDNQVSEKISIDPSNPENQTLLNDMSSNELQELRNASDNGTVDVNVDRIDGETENLVIVALENEQVVSTEGGDQ